MLLFLNTALWISFAGLSVFVGYWMLLAIAGRIHRIDVPTPTRRLRRIAVLIPAYQEDAVIVDTAHRALLQDYPAPLYEVVVIADGLQPKTMTALHALPITVVPVQFAQSTKAKALRHALAALSTTTFDLAVVLDADNVMAKGFLDYINAAFEDGATVVQGQRIAKNDATTFAWLDAASEAINNHLFRQGQYALGCSASLIGSGMAFNYVYFRSLMRSLDAVGGFDKALELRLLSHNQRIHYLPAAKVYDEKVQRSSVFLKQRTRWLAAQLHYGRESLAASLRLTLQRRSADAFTRALQLVQPPRLLMLGLLPAGAAIATFVQGMIGFFAWTGLFTVLIGTLLLSLPRSFYSRRLVYAMAHLPWSLGLMLLALLRSPFSNRTFLHTPHEVTA